MGIQKYSKAFFLACVQTFIAIIDPFTFRFLGLNAGYLVYQIIFLIRTFWLVHGWLIDHRLSVFSIKISR